MRTVSTQRGFTLIELLTVIAIIAVLAAILFPVAGTVREQARAGDCMTKMHQLWVAANVYRQDEGVYPPVLMGYAEYADNQTGVRNNAGNGTIVPATQLTLGKLVGEQVKDPNVFRCPDNINPPTSIVVKAYIPAKPAGWPQGASWIGDAMSTAGCTDQNGPFLGAGSGGNCTPYLYYVFDSYDISPRLNPQTGRAMRDGQGAAIYELHYSPDWTGITGANDLPVQLKYANPPDDKTMLTYCTYHAATAGATSVTIINMGGTTKKLSLDQIFNFGPNIFNR